jgi:Uma2 family endonuclease
MLRDAPVKTQTTFEEYVAFETQSDVRHEFDDGNLYVMPGGTKRHNMIAGVLYAQLLPVTLARGCFVFFTDVIVRVPSGKGFYPDLFVTCDSSLDSKRVAHRPSIIIEVLSDSTELIDRGEKWQQYQRIPSLEQYVLLSQHEPSAEVFSRDAASRDTSTRQGDKWLYELLTGDGALRFPSLEKEIVLSSLYQNLPTLDAETD